MAREAYNFGNRLDDVIQRCLDGCCNLQSVAIHMSLMIRARQPIAFRFFDDWSSYAHLIDNCDLARHLSAQMANVNQGHACFAQLSPILDSGVRGIHAHQRRIRWLAITNAGPQHLGLFVHLMRQEVLDGVLERQAYRCQLTPISQRCAFIDGPVFQLT